MVRRIEWAVALMLATLLVCGCDAGAPGPPDPGATATAQAAGVVTVAAQQRVVLTFTAGEQATSTAQLALLDQLTTRLQVDLQDGGPTTVAGTPRTAIRITVANRDQVAHQVVIRVYDKD